MKENNSLAEKALFVSGRDVTSIKAFSEVLKHCETPVVLPEDVALVRDPVLSDKALSDTEGTCWRQTEGMQTRALRQHILYVACSWPHVEHASKLQPDVTLSLPLFSPSDSSCCSSPSSSSSSRTRVTYTETRKKKKR